MEKVSVILPIYNVEKYLKNCIESVRNQTYENLEIILVDDGSTDNSGKICDEIAKSDERVMVIHKQNGGLAAARNTGYLEATGTYLMYIDSDDIVKKDVVKNCVEAIGKENSDVVIFGYEKVDETGNIIETCKWKKATYTNEQMLGKLYDSIREMSFGYAWNKLYRKSVIDESKILGDAKVIDREDLIYNLELLNYWKKITYIDYVGYEYLQRSTSLLHNSNLARLNGIEYFVEKIFDTEIKNNEVKKKVFIAIHFCPRIRSCSFITVS